SQYTAASPAARPAPISNTVLTIPVSVREAPPPSLGARVASTPSMPFDSAPRARVQCPQLQARSSRTIRRGNMRIDWLKWFALVILALLLAAATAVLVARASLPRREGEAVVPRLSAPLAIDLDARAVPRIHGASFEDVLRGEGYMHAQERFFQMDLLRRSTAGELAALIGARVLPLDRAQRPFDYRRRAHELLARLPAREQVWLAAYTD